MAYELLHTIKKKKGKCGLFGVKVDMNKVYNRLEWNFIIEC